MNQSGPDQLVIVITNAASPAAQQYASHFVTIGAKLLLNYPPNSSSTHTLSSKQEAENHDKRYIIETHLDTTDADNIIAKTLRSYGAVHVLVHDISCRSPSPTYDLISSSTWEFMRTRVLDGAFKCSKAIWPHFRKQRAGKILFVDSEPLGHGVAETAARFSLFGFTQTLAQEGAKYKIQVNLVTSPPNLHMIDQPTNAYSHPSFHGLRSLVGMLSLEANGNNPGTLFTVDDHKITKFRWERSKGVFLNPDVNFGPGALARKWDGIDDFSERSYPVSVMDFGKLLPQMQALPENLQVDFPSFSGRVVLVTGAASGLGRAYSIAFGKLGACVIVNDLTDPQAVVDEILRNGGQAVPVIASVERGDYIVQRALEAYQRIDILINNAGFVRDKSFANMDEHIWRSVMDVHLNGTYRMTKAVWPHFVRQRQGCIVNTTSTSGIYGNFGQSNYSAAKLGILGISKATAREGRRHSIRVNTIAPVASTGGLAAALLKTDDKNKQPMFLPEYVVPIVLVLCSETINGKLNDTTDGLFEVGCGWHARTRLRPVSENELDSISKSISNNSLQPHHQRAEVSNLKETIRSSAKVSEGVLNTIAGVKSLEIEHTEYNFTDKDIRLYNLSVGAKRSELSLIWEEDTDFQAIPTFGVIPFFSMETIYYHGQILPNFKPTRSLLGEIYLEILQDDIPRTGCLSTTRKTLEVLDKDNAAVAITGYTTKDTKTGKPLFYNEVTFFMQGAGAFGGIRNRAYPTIPSRTYSMPARQPDAVNKLRTSEEQAAWYRLTGDGMALHIDPKFSEKGGFPVPVLHGMCFMGIAGRHLFLRYGPYYSMKVRFTSTVVPGQTLCTEMWESETEKDLVLFQVRVVETGKLCISGGGVRLRSPLMDFRSSRL